MMGNVSLTNRGLDLMNYETDPALTALEGGGGAKNMLLRCFSHIGRKEECA